ncbi:mpv17 / PMP22 family domain-containing protein [Purpureocillium lilacinum]|uniref:Mpv17 / PMP22 family domain-containing protein n=1 Tax=Purpureocillium lilacinum TaxID=33203 RepID=A0A179GMW3_PURLI|nr:mpv17 / PMP22 family domain-containing protein [Purpureocillium lilacinum]KAK4092347.1 hypothetical protein Purlil1_3600 [Purpureocillium lilacinum]OAQ78509.1 mpv17 / PMP22 family domain-containing protein [Purpureocillium lilacinum]OAQ93754.1 mpv17 / PMP22 family domain-containing protein [Purpureocillium lilacinum]PWI76657.1 hypothetical protein PCL_03851 [Purpureocillium lilacinum]
MDVSVFSATTQAVLLNGMSSIVAQAISVYKSKSFRAVDIVAFTHVLVYTALTTPPNHKWQQWLEFAFPTQTPVRSSPKPAAKSHKKRGAVNGKHRDQQPDDEPTSLSVTNTVAKFILDQTLGAAVNTILFICLMDYMKTNSFANARSNLEKDFWPMLLSSYKLWPFICLINLTIVPFEYRVLVGSAAGLAWGVYINLMYA